MSLVFLAAIVVTQSGVSAKIVATPPVGGSSDFYVGNRAPLIPTPLLKLPVGAVKPRGWLQEVLNRQRAGLNGQLTHISAWLNKEGNAWLAKDGKGKAGWEEVPYWLKGYISLAYVLDDASMKDEAQGWIEAALASQRPNGDFGPDQRFGDGTRDFWANMLMLSCLRTYYEATGDQRVLVTMRDYFRFQASLPEKEFLTGYWQHVRGGDNLSSIYWLYNMTGEPWLLDLAKKNHARTSDWTMKGTLPDWHNVNVAQAFDEPAIFYQQSKNKAHLQAAYDNFAVIRQKYGQVPGGMYGADENAREGQDDPRQAIETCGMVEQMYSDEELFGITGDIKWADHCEEVAFNTYPAAMMPDLKSLRYLTAPNMATADRFNHAPGFQNGGPMTIMNPLSYRCCQHNHGFGWPYFAEHLWMATNDGGLAAALYSASDVTAKVAGGKVTIRESTNYPFEDSVRLSVDLGARKAKFPLYLRIPNWCDAPVVSVNGRSVALPKNPKGFVRIERTWRSKDQVLLRLPMRLSVRTWAANANSRSVDYGPLTLSLRIGEKTTLADSRTTATPESEWQPGVDASKWPAFEITPTTPWNVALSLDPGNPVVGMRVVRRPWPKSNFPFTLADVPISVVAKGAELPAWQLDRTGLVARLQASPTTSSKPIKEIELVPMGAARLRITAFPWLSPDGKPWVARKAPLKYLPKASHVFAGDDVWATCDQELPKASNDESIPRFTWWDHKGTAEWIEYTFDQPKRVSGVEVYWFDDTGKGECRVPASWRLMGLVDGKWIELRPNAADGVERDKFNRVSFKPVVVSKLRLEAQLQDRFSAGILEWRVLP